MDPIRLGHRLRELRRTRKLSLRAVSRKSHIALSFLSALERGKTSISVANLKSVLEVLGMTLGKFFSQDPQPLPKTVYRKSELVEISGKRKGLSFLEVGAGRSGRALQLILEHYAPQADTGPELYSHAAEEAGLVLKGKLELTVDGQTFVLGPGDAYYFDSRRPHRVRNLGKGPAIAVSVNTPPSF